MTSNLALLAAATEPCPDEHCPERRIGGFEDTRPICKTCAGSGKVPLIPGLREPCPSLHPPSCEYVGCPGYTIVPEDTALRVLLEWLLKSEWPDGAGRRLQLGRVGRGLVCMIGPAASAVKTSGKTVLEALTAALVQALGLEVKRA